MLMRPDLHIANEIDTLIRYSFEAGLLQKWTSDHHQWRRFPDRSQNFEVIVLTIDHLAGAWCSLAVAWIIGGIICILEVRLHRYVNADRNDKRWIVLRFECLVLQPERNAFNYSWGPTCMSEKRKSNDILYPYLE